MLKLVPLGYVKENFILIKKIMPIFARRLNLSVESCICYFFLNFFADLPMKYFLLSFTRFVIPFSNFVGKMISNLPNFFFWMKNLPIHVTYNVFTEIWWYMFNCFQNLSFFMPSYADCKIEGEYLCPCGVCLSYFFLYHDSNLGELIQHFNTKLFIRNNVYIAKL